jgi:hypothetical protein
MKKKGVIAAERIEQAIHEVRGYRVMLDSDLAGLSGVETRILVRAVKRNLERFPGDFLFELSHQEVADLRSHAGISRRPGHGGRRTLPYAFTEHGAVMVASVLSSPPAVEMSIHVVRAFVRLRLAAPRCAARGVAWILSSTEGPSADNFRIGGVATGRQADLAEHEHRDHNAG